MSYCFLLWPAVNFLLQDCENTVLECQGGKLQKCICIMATTHTLQGMISRNGTCTKQERAFYACSKVEDCVSKGVFIIPTNCTIMLYVGLCPSKVHCTCGKSRCYVVKKIRCSKKDDCVTKGIFFVFQSPQTSMLSAGYCKSEKHCTCKYGQCVKKKKKILGKYGRLYSTV